MKLTRPFAFLIGALLTGNAVADQVELSNGDKISGTLVAQNADEIVFDTGYAGQLKIKRNAVVSISTHQPLRIELRDGQQLDGILLSDDQGRLFIQERDRGPAVIDSLESIASMVAVPPAGPPPWDWRGNITFGSEMRTAIRKRTS